MLQVYIEHAQTQSISFDYLKTLSLSQVKLELYIPETYQRPVVYTAVVYTATNSGADRGGARLSFGKVNGGWRCLASECALAASRHSWHRIGYGRHRCVRRRHRFRVFRVD